MQSFEVKTMGILAYILPHSLAPIMISWFYNTGKDFW
jgi:hypothetical protein